MRCVRSPERPAGGAAFIWSRAVQPQRRSCTDRLRKFHVRRRVARYRRHMIRASLLAVASLILVVAAAPAIAAPSKGAQVPAFTLNLLQNRFGDQTYVPTRLPIGYRYLALAEGQRQSRAHLQGARRRRTPSASRSRSSPQRAPCDGGGAFHRIHPDGRQQDLLRRRQGLLEGLAVCRFPEDTDAPTSSRSSRTARYSALALAQVSASGKRSAKP